MSTAYERLLETEDGRRELCIEQTITNVTELICRHLDNSGISRSELARHMEVTPGRITQLLDGDANLTLRSIARALAAFGHVLSGTSEPIIREELDIPWKHRFQPEISSLTYSPQTEGSVAVFSDLCPRRA